MNKIIGIGAAVVLIGGAAYFYTQSKEEVVANPNTKNGTDTSSGLRVEENMVIVLEQKPGNTVTVSQVHLTAPGFVAIHEDANSGLGAVIGSSALLGSGGTSEIFISLSKNVADGTRLRAMLHNDTNGNGTFDPSDAPVQSSLGGSIEGWFEISTSTSANPPVSI
jgi:hypothetical protein